jgi:S-adenosylmethionine:tRNA-ribosyltransferase-isomerase (queuine synthetase)
VGDRLLLGTLVALVERVLSHPCLIEAQFQGLPAEIWEGIARHGRPIQYAHMSSQLALWDVWTAVAGAPTAFEPPSAGFVLDWELIASLRHHGIGGATSLRVVNAILSGTHEPGTSHYELLHAFADATTLAHADRELEARGYRTHEFGDSVFVACSRCSRSRQGEVTANYTARLWANPPGRLTG